jgi:hypothetical protein
VPFKKFAATATLKEPSLRDLSDWDKMYGKQAFGNKMASATKKVAEDHSNFLLSHCTIMTSVACEVAPHDYLITPSTSHLVNSNQDAWSNAVLKKSYKSFVGAFNFLEHYQNTKHNKGHILDAILRKVTVTPVDWVYFVDLLVATDINKDPQLVEDIRSEKMNSMSMGCVTDLVICSFCGARVVDSNSYCEHLDDEKGNYIVDEEGIARIVAELCGHESLPNGGVKFVEASWVKTPAALSATRRSTILDGWVGPKTPYTVLASGKTKTASKRVHQFSTSQMDAELRRILR